MASRRIYKTLIGPGVSVHINTNGLVVATITATLELDEWDYVFDKVAELYEEWKEDQ